MLGASSERALEAHLALGRRLEPDAASRAERRLAAARTRRRCPAPRRGATPGRRRRAPAPRRARVPRTGKCTLSPRASNRVVGAATALTAARLPATARRGSARPGRRSPGAAPPAAARSRPGRRWQRGAKRQPSGSASGSGGTPGIGGRQLARSADLREGAQQALRVRVLRLAEDVARSGPVSAIWPPYMIATRSHVSAITDRSCVIRSIAEPEVAPQLLEQLEDLGLRHHVERRRRLVADDQLRVAGERERDHHALAHAARELVRVLAGARRADADVARSSSLTRASTAF